MKQMFESILSHKLLQLWWQTEAQQAQREVAVTR